MKNLTIMTHLDDEILGMGGFLARSSFEGDTNFLVTFCKGRTNYDSDLRSKIVNEFCRTFWIDHTILGYWDLSLDNVPQKDLSKNLERCLENIGFKFDNIFIPSQHDLHFEHQIVSKISKVVLRDVEFKRIFEVKNPCEIYNPDNFETFHVIDKNIFNKHEFVKKFKTEHIPTLTDIEFFKTIRQEI